jgi:hypothetical protein
MSFTEITEALHGVRKRHEIQGIPLPEIVTVDNCCTARSSIKAALPAADVVQDVRHFKERLVVP